LDLFSEPKLIKILNCTMCGMMLHIEGTYNEVYYTSV
jgi:hypothetical protein